MAGEGECGVAGERWLALGRALSSAGMDVTLIVDGANVMGSRADGWWRDRAGAMARLHDELAALATRGIQGPVPGDGVAPGEPDPGQRAGSGAGDRWFPSIVLVVEGRTRAVISLISDSP